MRRMQTDDTFSHLWQSVGWSIQCPMLATGLHSGHSSDSRFLRPLVPICCRCRIAMRLTITVNC